MLTFYLDDHVAKAVAVQLVAKGMDAIHCADVDMRNADDIDHLAYAVEQGRVLVSQDDDFAVLHGAYLAQGKPHSGIMLIPRRIQGEAQISHAVKELSVYHEMISSGVGTVADDIESHLIYL